MSQELGRHVRDKVCRHTVHVDDLTAADLLADRTLNPEILVALSLRSNVHPLPVITAIPTSFVDTTLATCSTMASPTTMAQMEAFEVHPLMSADDDPTDNTTLALLIDNAPMRVSHASDDTVLLQGDEKTLECTESLWGCKQCDFRCVN